MQATPTEPATAYAAGRALSRRGLLAAGGAAVLSAGLAGCAAPGTGDAGSADGPPETTTGTPTPSLSPDVALATLALAELRAAELAVTSTSESLPGLRAALRPVAAMHAAHEAALADAVPPGAEPAIEPAPYAVPGARPAALDRLREREVALQSRLGELAVDARSGAFAGLLASMSAGTAQRVATWPT